MELVREVEGVPTYSHKVGSTGGKKRIIVSMGFSSLGKVEGKQMSHTGHIDQAFKTYRMNLSATKDLG